MATSLQWLLSFVPKVAIIERFDCVLLHRIVFIVDYMYVYSSAGLMIVKVFKNLSPSVSREATCFLHATLIPTEECANQMGGDTWLYYLGQCAKECCDLEPGTVTMISKRQSLTMCKPEFALASVTTTDVQWNLSVIALI